MTPNALLMRYCSGSILKSLEVTPVVTGIVVYARNKVNVKNAAPPVDGVRLHMVVRYTSGQGSAHHATNGISTCAN